MTAVCQQDLQPIRFFQKDFCKAMWMQIIAAGSPYTRQRAKKMAVSDDRLQPTTKSGTVLICDYTIVVLD